MSIRKGLAFLRPLAFWLVVGSLACAQWAPLANDANAAQRIEWWQQARFGMFLHWGLYSIPARGEWVQWNEQIPESQYAKFADQFNPQHFDPDAWAALAKEGGMKYMVLTARHHDGFALFNDPGNNFTAVSTAAHRDLIAEYVSAVRKAGLGVGLYYSPLDWRFPGFFHPDIYRESAEQMRAQYARQVHELASHYGKLDILWFDGGGDEWLGFGGLEWGGSGWHTRPRDLPYKGGFHWEDDKTVGDLRKLQPQIVMNDRTDAPADYRSREGDGALGDFENRYPWELCVTILQGPWGYQKGAKVKPLEHLIHLLVGAAGRDGNFLLNVSPQADGTIQADQAERVREIGRWLSTHGQSIYSTRGGPWLPGPYGVSTHNGATVYIHVLQLPKDGVLRLPALPAKIVSASVLNGAPLRVGSAGHDITIAIPAGAIEPMDTVLKLELDRPWTTAAVVPVPAA